ncbi:MAG: sulfite exporter TauE/SafE family protein [Akkermansiaceae bacterium]
MMLDSPMAWTMALCGALCVGLSKTGFTGISMISVLLFADLFGAKTSVGLVLPLLVIADLTVYPAFREHGSWKPVGKLLLPALIGLALGYVVLAAIDDHQARKGIGVSVLLMVAVQAMRFWNRELFHRVADSQAFGVTAGVAGGMATMIANAAGPVIQLFLLSRRIPKMELIGISARFFLLINLIKVPMTVHLSLTTWETLKINFLLVPGVWLGVATGKFLVKRVPQRWFEGLVIAFSLIAGLRLCLF